MPMNIMPMEFEALQYESASAWMTRVSKAETQKLSQRADETLR